MDGSTLFIRVLSFLDEMAKDQVLLFGGSYSFIFVNVFIVVKLVDMQHFTCGVSSIRRMGYFVFLAQKSYEPAAYLIL